MDDCVRLTISGTGANLNNDIGGLEKGFFDNGIADTGVLEDMLAKVLVESEDVCVGGPLGGFAIVRAAAGPGPLLLRSFGHGVALECLVGVCAVSSVGCCRWSPNLLLPKPSLTASAPNIF